MVSLEIYVTAECWSCEESKRIAAEMREEFPRVAIELVDLQSGRRPSQVFAAPTYVLNGRVISLGNPTRKELREKLKVAQCAAGLEEKGIR